MHTTLSSWLIAFSFLLVFGFFAGLNIGRGRLRFLIRQNKDNDPLSISNSVAWGLIFLVLFFFTSMAIVATVESSMSSVENIAAVSATYHDKINQRLDNRHLLSAGWYEVKENPQQHSISPNSGDTIWYVEVGLSRNGIGPIQVAFPIDNWRLTRPKPKLQLLGTSWIQLPQPPPKFLKLEEREEKEYARDVYVVDSK